MNVMMVLLLKAKEYIFVLCLCIEDNNTLKHQTPENLPFEYYSQHRLKRSLSSHICCISEECGCALRSITSLSGGV